MLYLIDPKDLILQVCPTKCATDCSTYCHIKPLYGPPTV